jgi:oxygen-independent coproporphyrinogen-3 oxidase
VFFGGGTPSLWAPAEVGRVLGVVKAELGLAEDVEITLEANPGTVHERLFEAFVAAGVNRFSIGAQSFDDRELAQLGRIHGALDAGRAVRLAKASGARVSLDLIYGQPGQTWAAVSASLDRALELETEHLSAYTLTLEPGTPLSRQAATGEFVPMDEDAQAELIERVSERLNTAGLVRYEISNYARPGCEAVHNTLYWVGAPYLGVGAGAHGYSPAPGLASAVRRADVKSPEEYVARALLGQDPVGFSERLDRRAVLGDRLLVGFRVKWGLDLGALDAEAELGGALVSALAPAASELVARGLLAEAGSRLVPTGRGFLFADLVAVRLLTALEALAP